MFTSSQGCYTEQYHCLLSYAEIRSPSFIWEKITPSPFDELIVSWDAQRPSTGAYLLRLSVLTDQWSPWLDYAAWSTNDQHTFQQENTEWHIKTYQDSLECLNGIQATGFRVWVEAQNRADLQGFRGIHACATDLKRHAVLDSIPANCPDHLHLDVPKISQMALQDARNTRLCSPTSTTAVLQFLSQSPLPHPLSFANEVIDTAFDIYGNWILNTAQAAHYLKAPWQCYVTRLTSFEHILERLSKGYPVIVSIRGPLAGSALPYQSGHLLVVRGYAPDTQEVLCMDPAFAEDEETSIAYPLQDFITAWKRRRGLAYIFERK